MARPTKAVIADRKPAAVEKNTRGIRAALQRSHDIKGDHKYEHPPQWRDMTNRTDLKNVNMVELLRDNGVYRNVDFSGSDLSGAFFQFYMGANGLAYMGDPDKAQEKLIAAGAKLQGCKFNNCKLTDTDFSGCDLRWSDFTGSNYQEARFVDDDLGLTANVRETTGVDSDL
jgi:uncharacterized protein YjbI with pentapeptide repeats